MHPTQVIRQFQADEQGMRNRLFSVISVVLVAGVALVALVFFSINPFRVGKITITTPNGSSVTVKVANSNEFSELIQEGLKNPTTEGYVTNSLLNIIDNLPVGSKLGDKLMELAQQRKPPFFFESVPVKLVYDSSLRQGHATICEKSKFLAKNITVYAQKDEFLYHITVFAVPGTEFPCLDGAEIVRLNSREILELNSDQVMAKRTL